MADLADLAHQYGQDLGATPTGDIAVATKRDRTTQRIIRRLLTVPTFPLGNGSPYPWEPDYGVGLGTKIGETVDVRGLRALTRSQMLLEATVQKVPAPKIDVTPLSQGGATIDAVYTDLSGEPQGFSFNVVD